MVVAPSVDGCTKQLLALISLSKRPSWLGKERSYRESFIFLKNRLYFAPERRKKDTKKAVGPFQTLGPTPNIFSLSKSTSSVAPILTLSSVLKSCYSLVNYTLCISYQRSERPSTFLMQSPETNVYLCRSIYYVHTTYIHTYI